ncbi:hypothetical protein WDW37_02650 [Bdellovibrionota bacterium FG-1]
MKMIQPLVLISIVLSMSSLCAAGVSQNLVSGKRVMPKMPAPDLHFVITPSPIVVNASRVGNAPVTVSLVTLVGYTYTASLKIPPLPAGQGCDWEVDFLETKSAAHFDLCKSNFSAKQSFQVDISKTEPGKALTADAIAKCTNSPSGTGPFRMRVPLPQGTVNIFVKGKGAAVVQTLTQTAPGGEIMAEIYCN